MIFISIGSNLGDRLGYIDKALHLLKKRYFSDLRCSIILETEAIVPDAAPLEWNKTYLNAIAYGHSSFSPEALLQGLKEVEAELGRPHIYEKWAPRVIDLDILLWDETVLETPSLQIPHPQLFNRPFLLYLMAIISPLQKHPSTNKTFIEMADNTSFIRNMALYPRLVGIVNVTEDSFSDGGFYGKGDQAIQQAIKLSSQGAALVEIGAQSTRPGAIIQSSEIEYNKLKPVLDGLKSFMQDGSMKISIDSFSPEVIMNILDNYPISWINDVAGLDDETLKAIAAHGCNIVAMHSLSIPPQKNIILPIDKDPVQEVTVWIEAVTDKLMQLGFDRKSIIVDPGIGFGKSISQNIELMRQADRLRECGFTLLMGHSRKSYIAGFSKAEVRDRDLETIAISSYLFNMKTDFIRVHNVSDHQRFFIAQQVISGGVYV